MSQNHRHLGPATSPSPLNSVFEYLDRSQMQILPSHESPSSHQSSRQLTALAAATTPAPSATLTSAQSELKTNFYNPYSVKHRRRTTKPQLALLEGTFESTQKPSSELRKTLATRLGMTPREVQIWFQNRRAKHKNLLQRAAAAAAAGGDGSSGNATYAKRNGGKDSSMARVSTIEDMAAANVATPSSYESLLPSPIKQKLMEQRASSVEQHTDLLDSLIPSSLSFYKSAKNGDNVQQHPIRRHSDLPSSSSSFGRSTNHHLNTADSTALAANVSSDGLSDNSLAAAAAALLPATATMATMLPSKGATVSDISNNNNSNTSGNDPTPASLLEIASSYATATSAQQHMPIIPGYGESSSYQQNSVEQYGGNQKKAKRAAGSGDDGSDLYRTARVHQEAFDGTNKLPLKPDDYASQTADDQFSMLDPSNLPNFMVPPLSGNSGSNDSNTFGHNAGGMSMFPQPMNNNNSCIHGCSYASPFDSTTGATHHDNLGNTYWNNNPQPNENAGHLPSAVPTPVNASSSFTDSNVSVALLNRLFGLSPNSDNNSIQPSSSSMAAAGPVSYGVEPNHYNQGNEDVSGYNGNNSTLDQASLYQMLMFVDQNQSSAAGNNLLPQKMTAEAAVSAVGSMPMSPPDSTKILSSNSPSKLHPNAETQQLQIDTAVANSLVSSLDIGTGSAFSPFDGAAQQAQPPLAGTTIPTAFPHLITSPCATDMTGVSSALDLFGSNHHVAGTGANSSRSSIAM